jgi:uncharacterized membrane protein YuzA (DUF378 family)
MEDYKNEISFAKKTIYWIIGLSMLTYIIGLVFIKKEESNKTKNKIKNESTIKTKKSY